MKYNLSTPTAEIEKLSIQSGEYSRFSTDPNIPRDKFEALYKEWIHKSLNKEIADEVLVILDNTNVAGMITLGNKNDNGDIGLLSVDTRYRGKKYGEMLVRSAQTWFIRNGYKFGHVVTQADNTAACRLYTKCGYSVSKVEYFYHFWM